MFWYQNFICISHNSHKVHIPCSPVTYWFHRRNTISWREQIITSYLCLGLEPPITSSDLGPVTSSASCSTHSVYPGESGCLLHLSEKSYFVRPQYHLVLNCYGMKYSRGRSGWHAVEQIKGCYGNGSQQGTYNLHCADTTAVFLPLSQRWF
jgi:hypothetical protein